MSVSSLSVFFPAFNEEENISSTVTKAIKELKKLKIPKWEIIIVDDGSVDKTPQLADKLSQDYREVSVIHQANGGYGQALKCGFNVGKYDWIVYNDADGQFDFSEITKFLDRTDQADLILGYRLSRKDPTIRLILAKGWWLTLLIFFGLKFKDVDCGFKMIKKSVWERISPLQSNRGAMVNAELAIKTKKGGFRIIEVGISHYPRFHGRQTGASIRVILNSYFDLSKLWWELK